MELTIFETDASECLIMPIQEVKGTEFEAVLTIMWMR